MKTGKIEKFGKCEDVQDVSYKKYLVFFSETSEK